MIRRASMFAFASLLSACHGGRAPDQVAVASAEVDMSAPAPAASASVDAKLRRKLLACGAAVGRSGKLGALSKADLPPACAGLDLDQNDLEALSAPPPAPPVPLDAPSASPGAADRFRIDVFRAPGCRVRIGSDGTTLDLDSKGGHGADELVARTKRSPPPDGRVEIAADSDATHGCVIRVVDLLKQAGVTKIAFAVVPAASTP